MTPTPATKDLHQHVEGFLCKAWGESDLPAAALCRDMAGVRQFLIDEWLGDEDSPDWEGKPILPGVMDELATYNWADEGNEWNTEFEIGGLSIERVTFPALVSASLSKAEATGEREATCSHCDGIGVVTDLDGEVWPCPQGCKHTHEWVPAPNAVEPGSMMCKTCTAARSPIPAAPQGGWEPCEEPASWHCGSEVMGMTKDYAYRKFPTGWHRFALAAAPQEAPDRGQTTDPLTPEQRRLYDQFRASGYTPDESLTKATINAPKRASPTGESAGVSLSDPSDELLCVCGAKWEKYAGSWSLEQAPRQAGVSADAKFCRFPECKCPMDPGPSPDWCAIGLPHRAAMKGGANGQG